MKVLDVISSCTTFAQLAIACRYARLWVKQRPQDSLLVRAAILDQEFILLLKKS